MRTWNGHLSEIIEKPCTSSHFIGMVVVVFHSPLICLRLSCFSLGFFQTCIFDVFFYFISFDLDIWHSRGSRKQKGSIVFNEQYIFAAWLLLIIIQPHLFTACLLYVIDHYLVMLKRINACIYVIKSGASVQTSNPKIHFRLDFVGCSRKTKMEWNRMEFNVCFSPDSSIFHIEITLIYTQRLLIESSRIGRLLDFII